MSAAELTHVDREALELLDLLCRQPSISAEGTALDETAALVEALLADSGFETRKLVVEGAPPAVYGEGRGRSTFTLLLYNHYDVQPVDPLELWESPPFEPTVRDGKLYARGTADNKGELAVRLAVLRALHEQSGGLPVTVRWIIEGEEEIASPHFDKIVRSNVDVLRADACLWEGGPAMLSDGRPSIGLGFKGTLAVRLDVKLLDTDAHSAVAGVAPSAAWRIVNALTSLRDANRRVRIDGFYDTVRPPTDAERRATVEMSDSTEHDLREALGITEFVDGLTGVAFRERLQFEPTANIAGIKTGYSGPAMKTVLPSAASAWLDFRLVPDQSPDETLRLLREHLDRQGFDDVHITVVGSAEAAGTPIEHPFVQRVVRVAERVSGRPPSIVSRAGGSLPIIASLQHHVGVPGLSAPDNPVSYTSRTHAPNENVTFEDIRHAVRFTHALFEDLGET